MAIKKSESNNSLVKSKITRAGVHAKSKTSKNKTSKNYKKKNVGQGK